MARETKEDRIVRGMMDQLLEHLHELSSIETNPNSKEADVERWCASYLKNCLGYTSTAGYVIRSQEAKGKMRPDLIVSKGDKPIFVVEVKKITFDLEKSDFRSGKVQLSEYLNAIGSVKWGILTNGVSWKLYDFSSPEFGGIEVASFDLKAGENDSISFDKKVTEELAYDVLAFHEHSYSSKDWDSSAKEAMAFSPESLARAILSADVIKYIGKSIRGEHDFKANLELLTDKVYWILEQGLNDAISGWNEAKSAEYQKYIKSQKRVTRRAKKARVTTSPDLVAPTAQEATPAPSQVVPMDQDKKLSDAA